MCTTFRLSTEVVPCEGHDWHLNLTWWLWFTPTAACWLVCSDHQRFKSWEFVELNNPLDSRQALISLSAHCSSATTLGARYVCVVAQRQSCFIWECGHMTSALWLFWFNHRFSQRTLYSWESTWSGIKCLNVCMVQCSRRRRHGQLAASTHTCCGDICSCRREGFGTKM